MISSSLQTVYFSFSQDYTNQNFNIYLNSVFVRGCIKKGHHFYLKVENDIIFIIEQGRVFQILGDEIGRRQFDGWCLEKCTVYTVQRTNLASTKKKHTPTNKSRAVEYETLGRSCLLSIPRKAIVNTVVIPLDWSVFVNIQLMFTNYLLITIYI